MQKRGFCSDNDTDTMPSKTPTANSKTTQRQHRIETFPLQNGRLKTEGRVLVQPQIFMREHPHGEPDAKPVAVSQLSG